MIVGRSSFEGILADLKACRVLSLDTETTGLRPYHGDRLFSIIIGASPASAYYFNFQPYAGLEPENILLPEHLERLRTELFSDPNRTWFIHNAKFDLAILAADGIDLQGVVHCTKAQALVEYNEHQSYDLDSCAERIGLKKDDAVEKYITANKLYEKREGANRAYTHKFYDRVPFPIISEYGLQDAKVGFALGVSQERKIETIVNATPPNLPSLRTVLENEKRLTRTVFRMEHLGVRIDRAYCVRAAQYEADRAEKATRAFKAHTGRDFVNSGKTFQDVFASEKDKWVWGEPTKTGQINPSFESDVLKGFDNPAAKLVLDYRDATSKAQFYRGFLYHADADDIIHPNYNQDGAAHGRFSSSNPNFQNLTAEDPFECSACGKGHETRPEKCKKCGGTSFSEKEFLVRKAIVPRPGFIFIMPDYDQMEYRMMFDVACVLLGYESAIVKEIKNGKDPHQATADIVTRMGTELARDRAKNGNFAFLYGSGDRTLAKTIGSSVAEARDLKRIMSAAAPEVANYVSAIIRTAETRRFIFNWLGRRCYFPDPRWAYRAPNYHIAGGCADVVKVVMNRLDDYFLGRKSRLVMTIHDELPTEVHESEVATVPREVKEIMESVYPWKYLPLTAGMEWSDKNLAEKKKGFPA